MWISILHFYFVHLWLLERLIIFSYAYGLFHFLVLWIAYSPFCLFSHFFVHICVFFSWKSFSICYATSLWIMYIENIFVKFAVDIFNLLKCLLTYTYICAQSCPTLCDYTVHGILPARILEWVVFPFSRESSQPRDWTQVSCIADGFFTSWATGKPKKTGVGSLSLLQWIFLTQELNWALLHCRQILTNWAIRKAWNEDLGLEALIQAWLWTEELRDH